VIASHPRLLLDEDVHAAVAVGLRRRGFDVVRAEEAQRLGVSDEAQLRYAVAQGRCLFSFNRGHFADLHVRLLSRGEHHAGIVICRQAAVGPVVRALSALLSAHTAEQLWDQLVWLPMSPRAAPPGNQPGS
jgi:hypothetical protein